MRYPHRIVCFFTAFVSIITIVFAHGAVCKPRFRGTINTYSLGIKSMDIPGLDYDDCPHCLNGGGKGSVTKAANGKWTMYDPTNRAAPFRHDTGLCGDPITDPAPRAHENGGRFGPPKNFPIVESYTEGQIIEFTADVTTNHNGFFQFFICDATKCGGDISDACFKGGHCKELYRVKSDECESQNSVECGPVDPNYPGRFYVPCRKGSHVGEHFMGGKYMQYKLPEGFSTPHAVIQWYWATANSCNPPGFKEYFDKFPMPGWGSCPGDGGAQGGRNPTFVECGGSNFPEEFWTCADVSVGSRSGRPTASQRIPPRSTPEPIRQPLSTQPPVKTLPPRPITENSNTNDDKDKETENTRDDKQPSRRPPRPSKNTNSSRRKCVINWQQCGGIYHEGSRRCCDRKYQCTRVNRYYSQCMEQ